MERFPAGRILNHAQLVWSTVLRERKHGDISVAINCGEAYQEEGPDSTTCTFSDNHDVVLVPVRLHAKIVTTMISGTDDDLGPTEDRSAAQPALESMGHNPTKAVSSAEITQTLNAPGQNTPGYAQIVNGPTEDRSAAQPALESYVIIPQKPSALQNSPRSWSNELQQRIPMLHSMSQKSPNAFQPRLSTLLGRILRCTHKL